MISWFRYLQSMQNWRRMSTFTACWWLSLFLYQDKTEQSQNIFQNSKNMHMTCGMWQPRHSFYTDFSLRRWRNTNQEKSYSNNTLISTWKNDFKGMLEWEVSIFQQVNWYWQRSGFMKSHQSRQQCGLAAAGASLSSHPAQEDAAPLIRWQERR